MYRPEQCEDDLSAEVTSHSGLESADEQNTAAKATDSPLPDKYKSSWKYFPGTFVIFGRGECE
jgi:hypothetical protein